MPPTHSAVVGWRDRSDGSCAASPQYSWSPIGSANLGAVTSVGAGFLSSTGPKGCSNGAIPASRPPIMALLCRKLHSSSRLFHLLCMNGSANLITRTVELETEKDRTKLGSICGCKKDPFAARGWRFIDGGIGGSASSTATGAARAGPPRPPASHSLDRVARRDGSSEGFPAKSHPHRCSDAPQSAASVLVSRRYHGSGFDLFGSD